MVKGKYYNLYLYLENLNKDEVQLSFEDIENIVGFKLSKSFYERSASWCGRADKSPTHSQKKAWEAAGYTVEKCYLQERIVIFKRLDLIENNSLENKLKPKKHKANSRIISYDTINVEDIEKVHNDVINSKNYGKEGQIIHDVFNQFKENIDLNVIAMKIAVIDITNSTNLARHKSKLSLYDLASIILNIKDFDKRVEAGDPELVNEISRKSKDLYDVNVFSFASKYCCYHNVEIYGRDDYSIYDSIVSDNLSNYIKGISKHEIKECKENFDYKKYNDLIGKLLLENNIDIPFKRRKLDHYIWYKGKGY